MSRTRCIPGILTLVKTGTPRNQRNCRTSATTTCSTAEPRTRAAAAGAAACGRRCRREGSTAVNVLLDRARRALLPRNLVLYHLNGVGPAAAPAVARATMIIRANALAKGVSAVRPQVVSTLLECLRRDILPLIPERGSAAPAVISYRCAIWPRR
ncbi:aromatic amino acid lyase [Streptomyces sp. NPDC005202]|uniref:aromatic amino acid lyase n=1 Tax=Streptomyces sp. NPDC005202 TaxID=3157021 RepID=UPI00339F1292